MELTGTSDFSIFTYADNEEVEIMDYNPENEDEVEIMDNNPEN